MNNSASIYFLVPPIKFKLEKYDHKKRWGHLMGKVTYIVDFPIEIPIRILEDFQKNLFSPVWIWSSQESDGFGIFQEFFRNFSGILQGDPRVILRGLRTEFWSDKQLSSTYISEIWHLLLVRYLSFVFRTITNIQHCRQWKKLKMRRRNNQYGNTGCGVFKQGVQN